MMPAALGMIGRELALAEALARLMLEPKGRRTVATTHGFSRPRFNGRAVVFDVELYDEPRAGEREPLGRTAHVEIVVRGPRRRGEGDA